MLAIDFGGSSSTTHGFFSTNKKREKPAHSPYIATFQSLSFVFKR